MEDYFRSAGLSKEYANHCVRITVASELHNQGFKTFQIAREKVLLVTFDTQETNSVRSMATEVCTIVRKHESTEMNHDTQSTLPSSHLISIQVTGHDARIGGEMLGNCSQYAYRI